MAAAALDCGGVGCVSPASGAAGGRTSGGGVAADGAAAGDGDRGAGDGLADCGAGRETGEGLAACGDALGAAGDGGVRVVPRAAASPFSAAAAAAGVPGGLRSGRGSVSVEASWSQSGGSGVAAGAIEVLRRQGLN